MQSFSFYSIITEINFMGDMMSQQTLSSKEVAEYIVDLGKVKIAKSTMILLLQGIMAGAFIAIGSIAYIYIKTNTVDPGIGAFLAAAVFPIGIIAILLMGYELITSNTMAITGAYNKTYKTRKVIKMLCIVWIANLIGAILIALLAFGGNIFTQEMISTVNKIAQTKSSLTITEMFLRGILCNVLVCTGVLMASSAKDVISKIVAIWIPIVTFILCSAEHIVANMFFLPMAYLTGADISLLDIANSFLVVSAGNYVGGAIIVGGFSYLVYLRKVKEKKA